MKKLLLIACCLVSVGAWAGNCDNTQCLSNEVKQLKSQLNTTYNKVYAQVNTKKELDQAQKAWLKYKEEQCGTFVVADIGSVATGSAIIDSDLSCQSDLLKQRVSYLKSLLSNN